MIVSFAVSSRPDHPAVEFWGNVCPVVGVPNGVEQWRFAAVSGGGCRPVPAGVSTASVPPAAIPRLVGGRAGVRHLTWLLAPCRYGSDRLAMGQGGVQHALRYRGVMGLARAGCDDEAIASYGGYISEAMIIKSAGGARQIMRARQAAEKCKGTEQAQNKKLITGGITAPIPA